MHSTLGVGEEGGYVESFDVMRGGSEEELVVTFVTDGGKVVVWEVEEMVGGEGGEEVDAEGGEDETPETTDAMAMTRDPNKCGTSTELTALVPPSELKGTNRSYRGCTFGGSDGTTLTAWSKEHALVFEKNGKGGGYEFVKLLPAGDREHGIVEARVKGGKEGGKGIRVVLEDGWMYELKL